MCGGYKKGENPSSFGKNSLTEKTMDNRLPAGLRGRVIMWEGMRMSDLIDREALLRQIDIDSEGEPGYYGDTWKFIDTIKSMPPAQLGTNLAEVGTDLISRQALLDKFEPWLKVKDYNDGELNMLKAILYEIRFMRSAEPKRGKWIDTGSNEEWYAREYKCSECGDTMLGESNFCPNCGADMRGEQDE